MAALSLHQIRSFTTSATTTIARVAEAWSLIKPGHQKYRPDYRPDIDGLRAIAVLSVVGFHAAPGRIPAGFIGVDIFFVISGYLISSIILKGLNSGTFNFIEFYSRRVKRIFPALLLVLVASLAIGYFILLDEQFKELGKHIVGGAGFVSNLVLWGESGYFDNAADYKPMLHLWSLGIEEQFYIVWPFLLWLAWKQQVNYWTLIAVITFSSFALNIYLSGNDSIAAFYSPFTRFWELLLGASLAHIGIFTNKAASVKSQAYLNVISLSGMSLLAVAFVAVNSKQSFPGWWALLPTVGSAFVIWAGPNAWPNRAVLSNRVLVWFGLISFPLYLWHWPLLSFLRILEGAEVAQWKRGVALSVSIVLAWVTYRLAEKPIRQGAKMKSAPLFLIVVMFGVGLVGGYGYFLNGFEGRSGTPIVVNAGEIGHFHFFHYTSNRFFQCTPEDIQKDAGEWSGIIRCFQSKNGSIRNIAIIGDSHAEHLFPGLADRLPESNIVFYGKGGLPFVSNREFDQIFENVLDDKNIRVVLISANWGVKLENYPGDQWKRELAETITKLTGAGKLVYLVDGVPAFSFMPHRCKYNSRLGFENRCSEPDRHSAPNLTAFQDIATENGSGSVNVIKAYDLFCQQGSCSMARDGILHFRDEHHLNVSGSALVAEAIAEQMSN